MEKPRAKLRDTFTSSIDTDTDADREPIISERSQALREIIRIHEQGDYFGNLIIYLLIVINLIV